MEAQTTSSITLSWEAPEGLNPQNSTTAHFPSCPDFAAPNAVGNLSVETWTNSSITLHWTVPDGPSPQNYIYWVQWPGDSDKNETRNTTVTSYTVEGLQSASSYEFSVWAEKNGVPGSRETLEGFTGQKHPVLFPLLCIAGWWW